MFQHIFFHVQFPHQLYQIIHDNIDKDYSLFQDQLELMELRGRMMMKEENVMEEDVDIIEVRRGAKYKYDRFLSTFYVD